jgi:hypothetical protein
MNDVESSMPGRSTSGSLVCKGTRAVSPLLARQLEDVHPHNQAIDEAIAVANAGVGDEFAATAIVDDLVDIHGDAAVRLLREALRLDAAGDRGELPHPVVADRLPPHDTTALPGVGPVDLEVHQLDRRIHIARVERAVGGSQNLLRVRDAPNLANDDETDAAFLRATRVSACGADCPRAE